MPEGPGRLGRWAGAALRFGISGGLLLLLFLLVDLGAAREVVSRVHLGLLAVALTWLLLDRLLHAWRWIILLGTQMREVPVGFLVRLHLISNFVANFLPFNVGNDGLRVAGLARYSGQPAVSFSSVVVDRMLGAGVLGGAVLVALAALVVADPALAGGPVAWGVAGALVLGLAGGLAFWKGGIIDRLAGLSSRWLPSRWAEAVPRVRALCLGYRRHPGAVGKVAAILVVSLGTAVVTTWLTARALGVEVPFVHFVLFVPIISFLSLLPVSANGLGVSEGGFVLLFTQVGATNAEALTLALTMRVLITATTLPGGVLLAVERWPKAPAAAPEAGTESPRPKTVPGSVGPEGGSP